MERFVKVRSVTLEKDAPVDNEIPSGETMNKLPDESRLSGTLRLKPLDDEEGLKGFQDPVLSSIERGVLFIRDRAFYPLAYYKNK